MAGTLTGAEIAGRLARAGCVAADEAAAELVAHATGSSQLEAWVGRRETGEPLAWITGRTTFCGHELRVDPGVYVPRPQTEVLARRAAALLARTAGRAVDLCTGSGAVAAHLQRKVPHARVVGIDLDKAAVRCASGNGVVAVLGDLGAALRSGCFDVVAAVAPYVPTEHLDLLPRDVLAYEPSGALDGGVGGTVVLNRVIGEAARLLRPGGWLVLELGGDQDELVLPELARAGFTAVQTWHDAYGDLRGLSARWRTS